MKKTLTDELLLAYADRRLDPETEKSVAAQLADDPEAQAEVEQLRTAHTLLGDAFATEADESVPDWLQAAVLRVPPPPSDADGTQSPLATDPDTVSQVVPLRRRMPRSMAILPPALAALLLLGIGVGAGWLGHSYLSDAPPGLASQDTVLEQALEALPSGETATASLNDDHYQVMPLLTFQDQQGRLCREFETRAMSATGSDGRQGVACRDSNRWVIEVLVAQKLLAANTRASSDDGYAPVSADEAPGPFEQLTEALRASPPLAPSEEALWLERGWQPQ